MDFNKYNLRLLENSAMAPNGACTVWQGATKGSLPGNYGVINITLQNGKRTVMNVHRVAKCIEERKLIDKQFDVSHLCHNKVCINVEHLSIEPHCVNNNRQNCRSKGFCSEHKPFSNCMLHLIMEV